MVTNYQKLNPRIRQKRKMTKERLVRMEILKEHLTLKTTPQVSRKTCQWLQVVSDKEMRKEKLHTQVSATTRGPTLAVLRVIAAPLERVSITPAAFSQRAIMSSSQNNGESRQDSAKTEEMVFVQKQQRKITWMTSSKSRPSTHAMQRLWQYHSLPLWPSHHSTEDPRQSKY